MITEIAERKAVIKLGHTGENEAVRVAFSLLPFKEAFPGGTPALLVRRKGDAEAYPVTLTVEGDTAYWTVTSADTEKAGFGQCELQWYLGDTLAKSDKFDFLVAQALEAGAEPPDAPSKRWFDAIQDQIGDLSKLTTKAKENLVAAINEAAKTGSGGAGGIEMQVSGGYIQYSTDGGETWENLIAVEDLKGGKGEKGDTGATPDIQIGTVTTLDAGADATASMGGTAESPLLNLGIPKGAKGDKGDKGDTGATGPQGAQGPAGDDYVLTDADKSEIAAEIIAGGVEAELGDEPLPAPASASVGQIVKVKAVDANGKVTQVEAVDMPGGSDASLGMTSAAVGQIAKITAVDADGKPTAWSPVDMPSGGGAGGIPNSALICDITLAEAAQAVSQTLEHNFYALHCIVNCGTSGVALLVDADGASVSGKINLMLDTTVASYNIRKYGLISYNAAAWKSYAIHAIWSPDRTFFKQSQNEELSTGGSSTVYHSFGGVTAMKGTLGADALSPDSGRTVNIVAGANTLLNAGVRVIIWGEYYE